MGNNKTWPSADELAERIAHQAEERGGWMKIDLMGADGHKYSGPEGGAIKVARNPFVLWALKGLYAQTAENFRRSVCAPQPRVARTSRWSSDQPSMGVYARISENSDALEKTQKFQAPTPSPRPRRPCEHHRHLARALDIVRVPVDRGRRDREACRSVAGRLALR